MEIKTLNQSSFSDSVQNQDIKSAILPLGSTEQHGNHLPFSTDTLIVEYISKVISERVKMFVLPAIYYGVSYEHDPMFNTSVDYNTLVDFISSICKSISKKGIKKVFLINGHHGNIGLLQYVGQNIQSKYGLESSFFYFINYWQMIDRKFDHAGEVETSLMMAIHPDLVDSNASKQGFDIPDKIDDNNLYRHGINMSINNPGGFVKFTKNGIWGNPLKASPEQGQRMLSQILDKIIALITDPVYD
jgi:creatinine amidohydrolase